MQGATTTVVSDAPSDYAELWSQWFGYVSGLVWKQGVRENEDVASLILIRFMERDFLSEYNPELVVERRGRKIKTNFKAFLSRFVVVYCRHYREQQGVRDRREPLKMDQPIGTGFSTWGELNSPSCFDDYTGIEEEHLVTAIRAVLVTIPPRSKRDVRDLVRLFDLVVEQVRAYGRIDRQAIASEFGVSDTAIGSWLQELRSVVRRVIEK